MAQNNQILQILDDAFSALAKRYPVGADDPVMTDVLMQVNADTGQLAVYDDDDNEVYSAVVEEWVGKESADDAEIVNVLTSYLSDHKEQLESLSLLKPYSFILVDEDKETVAELYLVDDHLMVLDSSQLMQGLDQDLDNFLDQLMKE
jgi:nitrate/nitrite-specific signal transduction histidine kinase